MANLKEENDQLRCQLHAYENENELLKSENKSVKDTSEKERKMMQNMIKGKEERKMMQNMIKGKGEE